METYAPSGAGVHPEHTLSLGDECLVAVSIHDDPRVRARRGVDQSVHEVYPYALQVHVYPQRQAELSELRVIVPRHGRHWRDACEGLELSHMGRGPDEEALFFEAAFAAGRLARRLVESAAS